jgi:hypothetical protein
VTNQNGTTEQQVQITNEMLGELFRRLPAAGEVMRMIMLESENNALKARLEALESKPEAEAISISDE